MLNHQKFQLLACSLTSFVMLSYVAYKKINFVKQIFKT